MTEGTEHKNQEIQRRHRIYAYKQLVIFMGSKITSGGAGGDGSHEIKRRLLLGRKNMTHLGSMLKSRDTALQAKICLVKAMVFPVVMYGCES